VTIKKLTRGNPTMAAKFAEIKNPDMTKVHGAASHGGAGGMPKPMGRCIFK
jgi:hypothetical protein